ncbi:MAG: 30S ribosomal protein S9 [Candidatus Margulisbacteria bacterium]|nr:30S ribosomal protein S9 [Candidatus Margulisiibacteriota bacterium]
MAETHKKAHKAKEKSAEHPKKKAVAPRKKKIEVKETVQPVEVKTPVHHAPTAHAAEKPAPVYVAPREKKWPVLPKEHKFFGTGRRKEATAKVWLTPGSGKIMVNGKSANDHFCNRPVLMYKIKGPLEVISSAGKYDIFASVLGGGVAAQATAVSMGIARALVRMNSELKPPLKKQGLLTRDSRMKERKKYGLKRARRAFQYTKR